MLSCNGELRRILVINKIKKEFFKNLVIDLRRFEAEEGKLSHNKSHAQSAIQNARLAIQEGSKHLQSFRPSNSPKLPSAVEMARHTARRIALETQAFTRLSEEIDTVLISVCLCQPQFVK